MIDWVFDKELNSGARSGGRGSWSAITPEIGELVREVLQNSKDAGRGTPVSVRFRLLDIGGGELDRFLSHVNWDDGLRPHLAAVAAGEKGAAVKQSLEQLEESGRLTLLLVEDNHAVGLTGAETGGEGGSSNFAGLCKDELFSSKDSETSGGSHGLGKAVLWMFSGFSTVLFNSTLQELLEGQENPRFIGRADLPWHAVTQNDRFNGGGWFGHVQHDPGRAVSLFGNEAREKARNLFLERPFSETGTSILVVGFREPAEETRTLAEVAEEIERSTALNFWPSMVEEEAMLKVAVEVLRDGEREYHSTVDPLDYPEIRPFIELHEAHLTGASMDELTRPGDIVVVQVPLSIPARRDEEETEHEGHVNLAVRLAEPELSDAATTDQVAYFRGAKMVVKYRNLNRISLTARPFHAAVMAGEARGTSMADRAIDRFLRAAEPVEHDNWTSTPKLKEQYHTPYLRPITDLDRDVRIQVRDLVSETPKGGERGPERLMKRFKIGGRMGGAGGGREFALVDPEAFVNEEGVWEFSGSVETKVETPHGWKGYVSVRLNNEDNRTLSRVRINGFTAFAADEGLRSMAVRDKATVMIPPDHETFLFTGTVDTRDQNVDPQFTTLVISVTGEAITG